jgi:threonine/homoserine/homoserine lactone efflux protein
MALFVAASALLIGTPGPAVLYIVARSLSQGRRAGLASVAGIETGNLVQATACALGLSALVLSSPVAFAVVRYAGAAYLVYLGVRRLLSRERDDAAVAPRDLGRAYTSGLVVALLNPKPALFFIAFLPQFADPTRGHMPLQLLTLGVLFVALATVGDGLWALLAGTVGRNLSGARRWTGASRYVAAVVYVGLGVFAALSR